MRDKAKEFLTEPHNPFFISGGESQILIPIHLPTGKVLAERFTIKDLLGTGNTAAVYLVEDDFSQEEVAAKVARVDGENRRLIRDLFRLEKRASHHLGDFRYVRKVGDYHECQRGEIRLGILTMELLKGESLADWRIHALKNPSKIDPLGTALEICRAVSSVVEQGVLPLDLSLSNILIVGDRVKLLDLVGIIADNPEWGSLLPSECATPAFISPEVAEANSFESLTVASLVFSVGRILSEILPSRVRREMGVDGILDRCLQTDPDSRYETFESLIADLEGLGSQDLALVNGDSDPFPGSEMIQMVPVDGHLDSPDRNDGFEPSFSRRNNSENGACGLSGIALFEFIEQKMATESLGTIYDLFRDARNRFPSTEASARVEILLASRIRQYRGCLEEAAEAFQQGNYQLASQLLLQAAGLDPGNRVLSSMADFLSRLADLIARQYREIDRAHSEGRTSDARALRDALNETLEKYGF